MYTTQLYDKDKMARARIPDRAISPKDAREISAALRGKPLEAGIALMRDVQTKKRAIRFTRFNQESAGHKPGTGPARYPVKAAAAFQELLESVKANAEFKDLDAELLRITHVKADLAARPFRYGRHRGRQGKRAHIEVVVQEDDKLKAKASKKKEQDVTATKQKAASKKAPKKPSKADAKETKPAKTETKAEKPESKPEAKAESKPETVEKPKAETKEQPEKQAAAPQKPAAEQESAPASEKAPAKAETKESKPAEKKTEAPAKETEADEKKAAEGGDDQ